MCNLRNTVLIPRKLCYLCRPDARMGRKWRKPRLFSYQWLDV